MTEAMPFLQKTILLSYDPRAFAGGYFLFFIGAGSCPPAAPYRFLPAGVTAVTHSAFTAGQAVPALYHFFFHFSFFSCKSSAKPI